MILAAGAYSSPVAETGERQVTDNKNSSKITQNTGIIEEPDPQVHHNPLPILPKRVFEANKPNSAQAPPLIHGATPCCATPSEFSTEILTESVSRTGPPTDPPNLPVFPREVPNKPANRQSTARPPPLSISGYSELSGFPPPKRTVSAEYATIRNRPFAELSPRSRCTSLSLGDSRLPENLANLAKISSPVDQRFPGLPPLLQLPEIRLDDVPSAKFDKEARPQLPNIDRIFDIVPPDLPSQGHNRPPNRQDEATSARLHLLSKPTPFSLPHRPSSATLPASTPIVPLKRPSWSLSSLISAAEAVGQVDDRLNADHHSAASVEADAAPLWQEPSPVKPTTPKRGRGRPRKTEKTVEVPVSGTKPVIKRGRGRPRKSESALPPPPKASRQVSPGNENSDSSDSELGSETSSDVPSISKRGRGRPRKHPFGPHPKPEHSDMPIAKPAAVSSCWTCKLRRKKCDQSRPVCATCTSLGIPCMGYDPNRPEYMIVARKNKEMRAKIAQIVQQNREQARKSRSPTISVVAQDEANLADANNAEKNDLGGGSGDSVDHEGALAQKQDSEESLETRDQEARVVLKDDEFSESGTVVEDSSVIVDKSDLDDDVPNKPEQLNDLSRSKHSPPE